MKKKLGISVRTTRGNSSQEQSSICCVEDVSLEVKLDDSRLHQMSSRSRFRS